MINVKSHLAFHRDIYSNRNLDAFLVSAVTSVLVTRFILSATGYFQLGGSHLHIAHVLWGGLLMLIANFIFITYITPVSRTVGAIISGFGFGLFIDELGKFITHDNNYFYQPTVSLIYIIFILLYLLAQILTKKSRFTKYITSLTLHEVSGNKIDKLISLFHSLSRHTIRSKRFAVIVITFFAAKSILGLATTISLINGTSRLAFSTVSIIVIAEITLIIVTSVFHFRRQRLSALPYLILTTIILAFTPLLWELLIHPRMPVLATSEWAEIISSSLAGLLTIIGISRIRYGRLSAYRFFRYSLLVSILLTQIFTFYHNQLTALLGLIFNIVTLISLRYVTSSSLPHVPPKSYTH